MSKKAEKKRASDRPGKEGRQSAYAMVLDNMITVNVSGRPRKLTPEDALQFKTYEDAINGSYSDTKTVVGWINEREAARKAHDPDRLPIKIVLENQNPVQIDEALLILGIAVEDESASVDNKRYLRLACWAVQDALDRKRSRPLAARDILDLREHVDDPDQVRWPKGS